MNKINSIITLRHFEKDEPLIIYSPEIADNVSLQMVNTLALMFMMMNLSMI